MHVPGKGSLFKVTFAGVLTTIAQVISIDLPEEAMETVEADELNNLVPGIPHDPTGRTEGGEVKAELFLDPTVHSALYSWLVETDFTLMKKVCAVLIGATPRATRTFTVAGIKLGGKIVTNDYVKGTLTGKLSGTSA